MADSIHIKLPDGSTKEVPKGTTALDVAKSISPRWAEAALAAKTNGDLIDLTRPLEKDTDLRILTDRDPQAPAVYRHSSAHLLAAAVLELFPATKLGHGPPTESGFFYDFYRPTPLSPDDVAKTEKKMQALVGQQLDLFSIQELAGPGLIFWHPKGGIIRKEMEDWMRSEYLQRGYSLVYTPHVARRQLWQTSGHEGYYSQNMFDVMELDDAEYRMKPMNCPFHILIYKDSLKSYRDLPVRLGELGTVYRYERSGVMHGLLRVRGFTQDDAHIFCTPEQVEQEIASCVEFANDVLKDFGFDQFQTELSTWNPVDRKNFVGSEEQWNLATRSLEIVLKRLNIEYKTMPGEAAFYGPKIDIKLVDAIGRLWQLSTVQFDFNLPQRFGLEYVAEDGSRKQPVMVHRALYGSVERFFGVLIEHYAGAFPVWLSPV